MADFEIKIYGLDAYDGKLARITDQMPAEPNRAASLVA